MRRISLLLIVSTFLALDLHEDVQGQEWNRDSSSVSLQNPYRTSQAALRAGQKLFRQHCATCHGDEGQGKGKSPALKSAAIQNSPPGLVFWRIKNGNLRAGMPAWSRLPDQQLWQLITFLQSDSMDGKRQ